MTPLEKAFSQTLGGIGENSEILQAMAQLIVLLLSKNNSTTKEMSEEEELSKEIGEQIFQPEERTMYGMVPYAS